MTPPANSVRNRIGLRALQGFAEIMRRGSATAAGKALGLTQPGISRLITGMEREIGFELFWRDKGRLVPTKEAVALYEEVELALAGVERVHSLIHDLANLDVGTLRLVAPPSLAEYIVPEIVARFLKRFPRVRVSIDTRSIATTKTMLITRVIDCALMKMPVDHPDLSCERLVSSESVCVLPGDHPLAAHQTLRPAMIAREPFVMLGAGNSFGHEIDRLFREHGLTLRVAAEAHTVGTACALAARGIGVAVVNEMLARPNLRDGLVARPIEPSVQHDYALVVSAQSAPSRVLEEFREEARNYFASLPAGFAKRTG